MNPGSIVRCRNREWVLLPSERNDVHLLRPLTGITDEVVAIHKRLTDLVGYDLPEERVQSATFPLPCAPAVRPCRALWRHPLQKIAFSQKNLSLCSNLTYPPLPPSKASKNNPKMTPGP